MSKTTPRFCQENVGPTLSLLHGGAITTPRRNGSPHMGEQYIGRPRSWNKLFSQGSGIVKIWLRIHTHQHVKRHAPHLHGGDVCHRPPLYQVTGLLFCAIAARTQIAGERSAVAWHGECQLPTASQSVTESRFGAGTAFKIAQWDCANSVAHPHASTCQEA